jgi:probable HAF family extracellular repeat protein
VPTVSGFVASDFGTLGGAASRAFGVIAAGQVVGLADTAKGIVHAMLWSPS